ncbi:MAG: peptidoglycan -binding protein [Lysobacteraceae bacterium]
MSAIAARRRRGIDFWPGFVDALASLLLVLVFVLLIFSIGQYVLSDAISGRDKALSRLNAELAALADTLSMEREAKAQAQARIGELGASLARTEGARDGLQLRLDDASALLTQTQAQLEGSREEAARLAADINALAELKRQLEAEIASRLAEIETTREQLATQTELSAKSAAQVELLNRQMAALRSQLDEISAALELANAKDRAKDAQIEDLGRQLNLALADKVNQLARYRSDFFGKLREALGERDDIVVVGDRFVVPAALLFPSGSDEIGAEGLRQIDRLAATLREVTAQIPDDIDWVLRIDGHTDRLPIGTDRFPSNWELSSARAIAIVKRLAAAGIPPQRLAANGFGEFHPLDRGSDEAALARNRRIEIQLTNR